MDKMMLQPEKVNPTKSSSFFKPTIQKKLSVGSANDTYEAEADAMANKVMRMQEPQQQNVSHSGALVQRKCAHCEQEEKIQMKSLAENITPLVQRLPTESVGESHAPSHVENQINSSRGGGSSMDNGTKNFMESRFGIDFSGVRIHTGSQAVQMSRELNAQAFTVGNDVYFNEGKYSPNTDSGRHLLAHELTHTVQQTGGIGRKIQRSNTCTYGEIRSWAITSLSDHSSPAGLADGKASIGSVCTSRNCHCVDGSAATAPGDIAAWRNIVAANGGTDLSGGGNYMCVGSQGCGFVHQCRPTYRPGQPIPAMRERTTNLATSGTAVVNGHTLYFYNDPRNGNCP